MAVSAGVEPLGAGAVVFMADAVGAVSFAAAVADAIWLGLCAAGLVSTMAGSASATGCGIGTAGAATGFGAGLRPGCTTTVGLAFTSAFGSNFFGCSLGRGAGSPYVSLGCRASLIKPMMFLTNIPIARIAIMPKIPTVSKVLSICIRPPFPLQNMLTLR